MSVSPRNSLSVVMDALRFPLIVLVLFMHVVPITAVAVPCEVSWASAYAFITEFVAHNFGRIAVPIFFLISGYLFFIKVPDNPSVSFFFGQWRKRLSTLVLPYVLWNLLKYLVVGLKGYGMTHLGFEGNGDLLYFQSLDLFGIFYAPLNEPLWYLRDLIWMVVFSPAFYVLFRYARHWGILALGLWYLSAQEIELVGFSLTAIFYFGLGAYYSISKRDMLYDFVQGRLFLLLASIVIISIGTFVDNVSPLKEYWLRPALILGVVGVFSLTDLVISRSVQAKSLCLKYASSVFFIYAVHEVYLKNWLNGFFYRLPMMDNSAVKLLAYFVQPLILLAVCLLLNYLVKRYLPKAYSLLTGGRL